jgi:protoporphyrinogen oxidase
MSTQFDHIVIGAGISGLGMAHFSARRGLNTLVLEKADGIGGCINSHSFPEGGGFWAELGSHTCFNSYGNLLEILEDLQLVPRLLPKAKLSYSLYRDGSRKSILSALHPLELVRSLPRLFFTAKAGKSVAEYYSRVLGERNYRELFGPAFNAVICQPAGDFPAELLFRKKPRRKEVVRSFTFPEGLATMLRAIAEQPSLEVQTGRDVQQVKRSQEGFLLSMADGRELASDYLTLAVPPDSAAPLLPADLADLAPTLGGIDVALVESVSVCVSNNLLELPPLAGLIAVQDDFFSMVSRDYVPDSNFRGFTFHFKAGTLTAQAQVQRAAAVLGVKPEHLAGIARTQNRLPALRTGQDRLVARIDQALAGQRLAMTGNYFEGVSIEDCLMRTRSEFQRLFPD